MQTTQADCQSQCATRWSQQVPGSATAASQRPSVIEGELPDRFGINCPTENIAEEVCHQLDLLALSDHVIEGTEAVAVYLDLDGSDLAKTVALWVRRHSWSRGYLLNDASQKPLPRLELVVLQPGFVVADPTILNLPRVRIVALADPGDSARQTLWALRHDQEDSSTGPVSYIAVTTSHLIGENVTRAFRIAVVDPTVAAWDDVLIFDDIADQWGRAFNQAYNAIYGMNLSWPEVRHKREGQSSRLAALYMLSVLKRHGYQLVKTVGDARPRDPEFPDECERAMAEMEHEDWRVRQHTKPDGTGSAVAEERGLKETDWAHLKEDDKERNLRLIRHTYPGMAALFGYQIRLSPTRRVIGDLSYASVETGGRPSSRSAVRTAQLDAKSMEPAEDVRGHHRDRTPGESPGRPADRRPHAGARGATPEAGTAGTGVSGLGRPRVAVDGGLYSRTHFGGAIRYLTGLVEGLVSAGAHVTLVMTDPPRPPALHLPRDAIVSTTVPVGVDVWLTDDPAAVASGPQSCRTVLIVHDIMQWEPGVWVPSDSTHGCSLDELSIALVRADVVVTVSRTTRAKLLDLLPGLDVATLVAIPHAASLTAASAPECGRSDVVLHVGARDGYKRFDLLLEAFAVFGRVHTASLVTVGGRKQFSDAERRMVERLGLEGRVRSLGYVADADLASWYAKARVVVMPSDAEGFGVPLLEAMAAGTPIVAADLPVVEEVTAGTAYVFRPGDAKEAAAALTQAWSEPSVSSLLVDRAQRARSWTWADAGALLLQSVRRVGPRNHRRRSSHDEGVSIQRHRPPG